MNPNCQECGNPNWAPHSITCKYYERIFVRDLLPRDLRHVRTSDQVQELQVNTVLLDMEMRVWQKKARRWGSSWYTASGEGQACTALEVALPAVILMSGYSDDSD